MTASRALVLALTVAAAGCGADAPHCWAPMPYSGISTPSDNPEGIRLGPDGALYVAELDAVYRIDPAVPGELMLFAQDDATTNLQGLDFDVDGNLLVASRDRNAVVRFDGTSGAFLEVFATGGFDLPNTPRVGPDGRVYISSRNTAEVFVYENDGTPLGVFAADERMGAPEDMDFAPDGALYVAARTESVVLRFNADGSFRDVFAERPAIDSPEGLSFGDDGSVWVNSRDSQEIVRFTESGTVIERIGVPSRPIGLTLAGCDQAIVTLREPGLVLPLPR